MGKSLSFVGVIMWDTVAVCRQLVVCVCVCAGAGGGTGPAEATDSPGGAGAASLVLVKVKDSTTFLAPGSLHFLETGCYSLPRRAV